MSEENKIQKELRKRFNCIVGCSDEIEINSYNKKDNGLLFTIYESEDNNEYQECLVSKEDALELANAIIEHYKNSKQL